MYCTSCGSEIPDNALFCAVCGAQARNTEAAQASNAETAQAPSRPAKPSSGSARIRRRLIKKVIVPAAAAVIIIAFGLCVALGAFSGGVRSRAAASYSYETVSLDEPASEGEEDAGEPSFAYLQVSCTKPNRAVEKLNKRLQMDAESAYAQALPEEASDNLDEALVGQSYYTSSACKATYFEDGVVCVLRSSGTTAVGAAHAEPLNECMIMDLDTGKEISAASFMGMSEEDLRILAWKAADAFLQATDDVFDDAGQAFGMGSESTGVPEGNALFLLSPDGVVALFHQYTIGSHFLGTPCLLICDGEGNGVATGEEYSLETSGSGEMTGLSAKERKRGHKKVQGKTEREEQARKEAKAAGKQLFTGTVRKATDVGYPSDCSFYVLDFGSKQSVSGYGYLPDEQGRTKTIELDGITLENAAFDPTALEGKQIEIALAEEDRRLPSGLSAPGRADCVSENAELVSPLG